MHDTNERHGASTPAQDTAKAVHPNPQARALLRGQFSAELTLAIKPTHGGWGKIAARIGRGRLDAILANEPGWADVTPAEVDHICDALEMPNAASCVTRARWVKMACDLRALAESPPATNAQTTTPSVFARVQAAFSNLERKLTGAARLLKLFDTIADAAEHFGAQSFSFTVFSEHVELSFETAKLWAEARHLATETNELTLSNGAQTKVLRVVDKDARDLFRVSFSSHADRARELRADAARSPR